MGGDLVESIVLVCRGVVHGLGEASRMQAVGSQDVVKAVNAVLAEVEQYLVNNLTELERSGSSGKASMTGFSVLCNVLDTVTGKIATIQLSWSGGAMCLHVVSCLFDEQQRLQTCTNYLFVVAELLTFCMLALLRSLLVAVSVRTMRGSNN